MSFPIHFLFLFIHLIVIGRIAAAVDLIAAASVAAAASSTWTAPGSYGVVIVVISASEKTKPRATGSIPLLA